MLSKLLHILFIDFDLKATIIQELLNSTIAAYYKEVKKEDMATLIC